MFALLICLALACTTAPAGANGDSPVASSAPTAVTRPDAGSEPDSGQILDPGAAAREQADLARFIEEIEFLIEEARRLEARASRKGVWFTYRDLATDLGRIRGGIADHLAARQRQPNEIVPIRGRYTCRDLHDARASR